MNIVEDIKRLEIEVKEKIANQDVTIKEQRQSLEDVRDLLKGLLNEHTPTNDTAKTIERETNERSFREDGTPQC